jgi:predicted short-subunit dehydrogenase-like oxidoreductase (DUF2520 family)
VTLKVVILGPGRAGRALAAALRAAGIEVLGLVGRRPSAGEHATAFAAADVVLVTVRDGDQSTALAGLAERGLKRGAVVLHASGATDPAAALDRLRADGHPAGTFHPLVGLSDPNTAAAVLRGAWIGVDGDDAAVTVSESLAAALGGHVLTIPRGAKPGYHAAAVIASNFPAVLAAAAEREMRHAGIDSASARAAVAHLMRAAIDHVASLGPERALTGPVSRGDPGTVARNIAALADDQALHDLYVAATRVAIELARAAGTTSVERLDEIRRALR